MTDILSEVNEVLNPKAKAKRKVTEKKSYWTRDMAVRAAASLVEDIGRGVFASDEELADDMLFSESLKNIFRCPEAIQSAPFGDSEALWWESVRDTIKMQSAFESHEPNLREVYDRWLSLVEHRYDWTPTERGLDHLNGSVTNALEESAEFASGEQSGKHVSRDAVKFVIERL